MMEEVLRGIIFLILAFGWFWGISMWVAHQASNRGMVQGFWVWLHAVLPLLGLIIFLIAWATYNPMKHDIARKIQK